MIVLLKSLPYIVIGLLLVACGLLYAHGKSLKADLLIVEDHLKVCQEANATDEKTIASLRADVLKANLLCGKRAEIAHTTEQNVTKIDALPIIIPNNQSEVKKDESSNSVVPISSSGDPILDELNRVFPDSADSKGELHKTADSASTRTAVILSCKVEGGGSPIRFYCLDGQNAKNLLKDFALGTGYQGEMKAIMDSVAK